MVGHHLPVIADALDSVLAKADAGPVALVLGIALVNAVAEELFFRGALHAAFERHRPVLVTTACYVIVTATTGNLALVVAAAVMGSLFSVERLCDRERARLRGDPLHLDDAHGAGACPADAATCRPPAARPAVPSARWHHAVASTFARSQ